MARNMRQMFSRAKRIGETAEGTPTPPPEAGVTYGKPVRLGGDDRDSGRESGQTAPQAPTTTAPAPQTNTGS